MIISKLVNPVVTIKRNYNDDYSNGNGNDNDNDNNDNISNCMELCTWVYSPAWPYRSVYRASD